MRDMVRLSCLVLWCVTSSVWAEDHGAQKAKPEATSSTSGKKEEARPSVTTDPEGKLLGDAISGQLEKSWEVLFGTTPDGQTPSSKPPPNVEAPSKSGNGVVQPVNDGRLGDENFTTTIYKPTPKPKPTGVVDEVRGMTGRERVGAFTQAVDIFSTADDIKKFLTGKQSPVETIIRIGDRHYGAGAVQTCQNVYVKYVDYTKANEVLDEAQRQSDDAYHTRLRWELEQAGVPSDEAENLVEQARSGDEEALNERIGAIEKESGTPFNRPEKYDVGDVSIFRDGDTVLERVGDIGSGMWGDIKGAGAFVRDGAVDLSTILYYALTEQGVSYETTMAAVQNFENLTTDLGDINESNRERKEAEEQRKEQGERIRDHLMRAGVDPSVAKKAGEDWVNGQYDTARELLGKPRKPAAEQPQNGDEPTESDEDKMQAAWEQAVADGKVPPGQYEEFLKHYDAKTGRYTGPTIVEPTSSPPEVVVEEDGEPPLVLEPAPKGRADVPPQKKDELQQNEDGTFMRVDTDTGKVLEKFWLVQDEQGRLVKEPYTESPVSSRSSGGALEDDAPTLLDIPDATPPPKAYWCSPDGIQEIGPDWEGHNRTMAFQDGFVLQADSPPSSYTEAQEMQLDQGEGSRDAQSGRRSEPSDRPSDSTQRPSTTTRPPVVNSADTEDAPIAASGAAPAAPGRVSTSDTPHENKVPANTYEDLIARALEDAGRGRSSSPKKSPAPAPKASYDDLIAKALADAGRPGSSSKKNTLLASTPKGGYEDQIAQALATAKGGKPRPVYSQPASSASSYDDQIRQALEASRASKHKPSSTQVQRPTSKSRPSSPVAAYAGTYKGTTTTVLTFHQSNELLNDLPKSTTESVTITISPDGMILFHSAQQQPVPIKIDQNGCFTFRVSNASAQAQGSGRVTPDGVLSGKAVSHDNQGICSANISFNARRQ